MLHACSLVLHGPRAASVFSAAREDLEDTAYGDDAFEESGEGSSCYGTKVWMPGAVKSEVWEAEGVKEQQLDVTAKPEDLMFQQGGGIPQL